MTAACHMLHAELNRLDVPQRVQYKLCTTVHWYLQLTVCDGMPHSDLRHYLSPAFAVCQLPLTAVMVGRRAFSAVSGPRGTCCLILYVIGRVW